jgi:GcrA cell cycle regulator
MTTNLASAWDREANVETLVAMWSDGASASEIARAIGQGVTRSSVVGKVHRMKLPKRENAQAAHRDRPSRHTKPTITGKKGRSGNPGVPSVPSIMHRIEGRANIKSRGIVEEGVDVTGLIAFTDRRIGKDCSWISGDPLDGAMCCGKPVVEGSQWCSAHHARVYTKQGLSNA